MNLYLRIELGPIFLELGRLDTEEAEPEEAIGFVLDSQTPMTVDSSRAGFRILGDGADIATDV